MTDNTKELAAAASEGAGCSLGGDGVPPSVVVPPRATSRPYSSWQAQQTQEGELPHLNGTVFSSTPSLLGHTYTSSDGTTMPHVDTLVPHSNSHLRLHRIYYDYTVPAGLMSGKLRDRPPNLKLGGICGDVTEAVIANLIFFLSGVRVACIDMFKPQQGRCAIWLQSPDEFALLFGAMDHKVWMAPVNSNAAIFVTDPDSYAYLVQFLESLRNGISFTRFPRHTVTVEEWIP